eukprot:15446411-Alexandrium_andersonii.AAC.1
MRQANQELCLECAALSAEDRSRVLDDYATARSHLEFVFRVKLAHWQQLPYLLAGLGHPDQAQARAVAGRALALFDAAGDDAEHHALSLLLCSPGSVGRQQLEDLAAGRRPLAQLPAVLRVAARLRFVPIAERYVEGLHARAHRFAEVAPHHGPVHIAWLLALPRLREGLQEQPAEFLQTFADACSLARSLRVAVREFGFAQHPTILKLQADLPKADFSKAGRKTVVQVLFHVDPGTLFGDFGGLGGPGGLPGPGQPPAPRRLSWQPPPALGSRAEQLWRKYAVQHFRAIAKARGPSV